MERSGFKLHMDNLYVAGTLTDDYGDDKVSESHRSVLVRSSKGEDLKFVCLFCLRNEGGNCLFLTKWLLRLEYKACVLTFF